MEPINIQDGEVVTEDGIYSMSMDWYHAQPCLGPSISSTGLRTIYHESPADFWAYSDLNEDRYEREGSDAFTFGRAAHALLLGDEVFSEKFAVVPIDAPPKPTTAQISARLQGRVSDSAKERFDFWDAFAAEAAGRDLLSYADLTHIERMARVMEAHPIVPLLLEGQVEQSFIWQDEKTGVWLKSRLDVLASTGDFADLKTTRQKDPALLLRDVRKRGYDMQLGLATIALEKVVGVPFTAEEYAGRSAVLIFVYKGPPYHVMPVEVDYDALYWARLKVRHALDQFAECMKTGHWPGPADNILTYTSAYEAEQLQEKQAAGMFPNSAD